MKLLKLSIAALLAGTTLAAVAQSTVSTRQSGFTATLLEEFNSAGSRTTGSQSITVGPVVETADKAVSLGQGSYQINQSVTTLPTFNWRQDYNGDGYYTENEVKRASEEFIRNNKDAALANVAAAFTNLGVQNGWYTWSHGVEIDIVSVNQTGFNTYTTSLVRREASQVFWTAHITSGSSPTYRYGLPVSLNQTQVVLQFEVYPEQFDSSLEFYQSRLGEYNWGGPRALRPGDVSGAQAGTLKWRAIDTTTNTVLSPSSGGWNEVDVNAQLDRPDLSVSATGTNPFLPGPYYDPVQCVASLTNPGCSTLSIPNFQDLAQRTGATAGTVFYQERVKPDTYVDANEDAVFRIEHEFNNRSVSHGDICQMGTFTTGGCFFANMNYETQLYVIDPETNVASFTGSDVVATPIHNQAGCTRGLQFDPVSVAVSTTQSSFPWYLDHYLNSTPATGPFDNWVTDMRLGEPRPRNQFPLEHIQDGDIQVLQSDMTVLGGSAFRGEDSLGQHFLYGDNSAPDYGITVPVSACPTCTPGIGTLIAEWCGLDGTCKNAWLNEACPAAVSMCTQTASTCTPVAGFGVSCETSCTRTENVTPCWTHGWHTNSCSLGGSANESCTTSTTSGADPVSCPAGQQGNAFQSWTRQVTSCGTNGAQTFGPKQMGAVDSSLCSPVPATPSGCSSSTNTGSDTITCANGTQAQRPWETTTTVCETTQAGSDPVSCPAGSTGTASQAWTRLVTTTTTSPRRYTRTEGEVCQAAAPSGCTSETLTGTDTVSCPSGGTAQRPWEQQTTTCTTTTTGTEPTSCPAGTSGTASVSYQDITTTTSQGPRTYTQDITQVCATNTQSAGGPCPTQAITWVGPTGDVCDGILGSGVGNSYAEYTIASSPAVVGTRAVTFQSGDAGGFEGGIQHVCTSNGWVENSSTKYCIRNQASLRAYNAPARVSLNCSAVEVENVVNDHFCTTVAHQNGQSVVNSFKQTFDEITVQAGLNGFFLTQNGACTDVGPYTGEVFQFAGITENRGPGLVGREPAYGYYVFEQASLRSRFQFSRLSCDTQAILPRMSITGGRDNPGNISINGVTLTKVGNSFEDGWRYNPGAGAIPGIGDCTVRPLTNFGGNAAKLQYECVKTAPQIPATLRYIETVVIN